MSENSLPTVVCGLNEITQVSTVLGLHTCLINGVALSKVKLQWDGSSCSSSSPFCFGELLRAVSHTLPSLSMAERTSGSLTCNPFAFSAHGPHFPWTRKERVLLEQPITWKARDQRLGQRDSDSVSSKPGSEQAGAPRGLTGPEAWFPAVELELHSDLLPTPLCCCLSPSFLTCRKTGSYGSRVLGLQE